MHAEGGDRMHGGDRDARRTLQHARRTGSCRSPATPGPARARPGPGRGPRSAPPSAPFPRPFLGPSPPPATNPTRCPVSTRPLRGSFHGPALFVPPAFPRAFPRRCIAHGDFQASDDPPRERAVSALCQSPLPESARRAQGVPPCSARIPRSRAPRAHSAASPASDTARPASCPPFHPCDRPHPPALLRPLSLGTSPPPARLRPRTPRGGRGGDPTERPSRDAARGAARGPEV